MPVAQISGTDLPRTGLRLLHTRSGRVVDGEQISLL
ncbi:hypothetical protein NX02_01325 [Sphingomonas sanxanigenens DSM 19645 = NX02]|uniref:Uncharacterized protein n=1 Tax=Sphingomonas sanxanigenens DSM 19645 = NX02 TaxID=1123269 RepID=W0A4T5_9SPHN|nr:hypothetical protein NX02_01325 [Sphingomonas sanxanigenens DSM 19645 = NX02]